MKGWVKVYRDLLDDELWTSCNSVQKAVFMTLLLMANHAPRSWIWKGQKYSVKPGQMITSLPSIQEKAGRDVSIQNVRTSLTKFKKLGFLTDESTGAGRLVTIVNWEKYQSEREQLTDQLTDDQQTTNRRLTPNKNERSKEVNTLSNKGASEAQENFEKLWKLYPNKKGKQSAFKHYKSLVKKSKDPNLNKKIQDGIVAYKKYIVANGTEPQFVKQGSTFFNQESWDDDWSTGKSYAVPEPPKQSLADLAESYYSSYNNVDDAYKAMIADGITIAYEQAAAIMTGGVKEA